MADMTADHLEHLIFYNLGLISFTLLVHEYCLTFQLEVERFWRTPALTWPNLLFYLNRYLTLFGYIPVVFSYFWVSSVANKITTCGKLQQYHQYLIIIIQLLVSALLSIRTYALYNRSRTVAGLLFFVIFVALIAGCWLTSVIGRPARPEQTLLIPVGCAPSLSRESGLKFAVVWAGVLLFDMLIFFLTVYKSVTLRRLTGLDLLWLLLRDGSVYFGMMIVLNLGNILTFIYGDVITRGVVTTLMNVASSILISRLMLNLRDPRFSTQLSQGTEQCTTLDFECSARLDSTLDYSEIWSISAESLFPVDEEASPTGTEAVIL